MTKPRRQDKPDEPRRSSWFDLKEGVEEDAAHNGAPLGPALREADGREVAGHLDALALQLRTLWNTYGQLMDLPLDASRRPQEDPDDDDNVAITRFRYACMSTWHRVFEVILESEKWFFREVGPPQDQQALDRIADAMETAWGLLLGVSEYIEKGFESSQRLSYVRKDGTQDRITLRDAKRHVKAWWAESWKTLNDWLAETRSISRWLSEISTGPGAIKDAGQTSPRVRKGKDQGVDGEYSLPMSKTEMRVRLANMAKDKFESFAAQHGLKKINRQLYQIRLDKMDARTRRRLETGR